MAKTNQISLYGMVAKQPSVNSDHTSALTTLLVMRADRDSGDPDSQIKKDFPIVATKDPVIIEKMAQWNENDIVTVKGVIVTKQVKNATFCTRCGKENIEEGTLIYVSPVFVDVISTGNTKEAALNQVYEHKEISNELRLVGDLCCDPQLVKFKKFNMCQYSIAVPRTFRVKGCSEDENTDYPIVKSYGGNAKEDLARLKKGAVVLIDGYLQTRSMKKETECSCGAKYLWNAGYLEVVPYETEYLRGYVTNLDMNIEKNEQYDLDISNIN